jgi:hypothetical protein
MNGDCKNLETGGRGLIECTISVLVRRNDKPVAGKLVSPSHYACAALQSAGSCIVIVLIIMFNSIHGM